MSTLQAVRTLLSNPTHWTQKAWARNADGISIDGTSKEAVSFCLMGAIDKLATRTQADELCSKLRIRLADKGYASITHFNDHPDTDHAAVLRLLDEETAALAKEQAQ